MKKIFIYIAILLGGLFLGVIALNFEDWLASEKIQEECYKQTIADSKVWADPSLLQSNSLYKNCIERAKQ